MVVGSLLRSLQRLWPQQGGRVDVEPGPANAASAARLVVTSQETIDILADPICILDMRGGIHQSNAAFQELIIVCQENSFFEHLEESSARELQQVLTKMRHTMECKQLKVDISFHPDSIKTSRKLDAFNWELKVSNSRTCYFLLGK